MRRLIPFTLMALALPGCGSRMAPALDLGPSLAPAGAAGPCPARYNFEGPTSVSAAWQAPTWAGGNVAASLLRSTARAACGQASMRLMVNITGSNYALVHTMLAAEENAKGKTVTAWVYFSTEPPADLWVRPAFIDYRNEWVGFDTAPRLMMRRGWNLIQKTSFDAGTDRAIGFLIQIQTDNGAAYAGEMAFDEITW